MNKKIKDIMKALGIPEEAATAVLGKAMEMDVEARQSNVETKTDPATAGVSVEEIGAVLKSLFTAIETLTKTNGELLARMDTLEKASTDAGAAIVEMKTLIKKTDGVSSGDPTDEQTELEKGASGRIERALNNKTKIQLSPAGTPIRPR